MRLICRLLLPRGPMLLVCLALLGCDSPRDQRIRMAKHLCEQKLTLIHTALLAYAAQHDGQLPDSLETLAAQGYLSLRPNHGDPDPLICPAMATPEGYTEPRSAEQWAASLKQGHVGYRLCTPRILLDRSAHTPLVADIYADHIEGGYVLFADGTIEPLAEEALFALPSDHSRLAR